MIDALQREKQHFSSEKTTFFAKKTVFPYENTVFSSSIRRSNDELR
jgi:hypothetical protein